MKQKYLWMLIIIQISFLIGCESYSTYKEPVTTAPTKTEKTEPVQAEPPKKPSYKSPREKAPRIHLPFNVRDKIAFPSRSKWYRLRISKPAVLEISLEVLQGDPHIDLMLMDQHEGSWSGRRETNGSKITEYLRRGIYYILVKADRYKDIGSYILTGKSVLVPGASMADAIVMKPGRTIPGTVGAKNGTIAMWYKTTIDSPSHLTLSLSSDNSYADLDLKIHDVTRTTIASSTGTGSTEKISRTVLEGEYYFQVLDAGDTGGDYSLELTANPVGMNTPGFSMDNPISITSWGSEIAGRLGDPYKQKSTWYKIDINYKICLHIRFEVVDPVSVLRIELIELKNEQKEKLPLKRTYPKKYKFARVVEEGTYFLRVYTNNKKGESQYTLSVNLVDDPDTGFTRIRN
jgi:hypothetical protein